MLGIKSGPCMSKIAHHEDSLDRIPGVWAQDHEPALAHFLRLNPGKHLRKTEGEIVQAQKLRSLGVIRDWELMEASAISCTGMYRNSEAGD